MAQSLSKIILHIIFSTKDRRPIIAQPVREELNRYIAGALNALDCPCLAVQSLAEHVHILCVMSRTMPPCKLLEEIKRTSSKWLKTQGDKMQEFYWQNGYGAFSISESMIPAARQYIVGQDNHHRNVCFEDEYRAFLRKHHIKFDEQYVWD